MIKSFFHYTSHDRMRSILNGDYGPRALRPLRRFIKHFYDELPEKASQGALFGVLEPNPPSWEGITFNSGNCPILSGDLLIEAFIAPEDDVYIADYSIFTQKKPEASAFELYKAYFESLAPVQNEDAWRGYDVQEVVSFSPIPFERLKITELRPKPVGADVWAYLHHPSP